MNQDPKTRADREATIHDLIIGVDYGSGDKNVISLARREEDESITLFQSDEAPSWLCELVEKLDQQKKSQAKEIEEFRELYGRAQTATQTLAEDNVRLNDEIEELKQEKKDLTMQLASKHITEGLHKLRMENEELQRKVEEAEGALDIIGNADIGGIPVGDAHIGCKHVHILTEDIAGLQSQANKALQKLNS